MNDDDVGDDIKHREHYNILQLTPYNTFNQSIIVSIAFRLCAVCCVQFSPKETNKHFSLHPVPTLVRLTFICRVPIKAIF